MSKRAIELRLTALLLLAAAVVAWLVTLDRMRGMDMGPGTDLGGLGWFAGVWAVMMAAMMLPSLVPMADAYAGQVRAGSETGVPRSLMQTTLFVGGYLLVWVLVGLAAWGLVKEVRSFDVGFLDWGKGGRCVAGAVIAAAGVYELTPMKARSLSLDPPIGGWRWGQVLSSRAVRIGIAEVSIPDPGGHPDGEAIGWRWNGRSYGGR